ncbi:MAG: hypothetical protein Q9195_008073 [Heterodermia aff. obscurata]
MAVMASDISRAYEWLQKVFVTFPWASGPPPPKWLSPQLSLSNSFPLLLGAPTLFSGLPPPLPPAPYADNLAQFHVLADALDPRPWMSLFAPDAILNYANNPTLTGHEEIIAAMEQSMSGLRSMKHEIGHIDVTPERIYQEAKITYVIKGDPTEEKLVVKGFAVVHKGVGEERLRRLDIYGDFSEVFGRMAEVGKGAEGERG